MSKGQGRFAPIRLTLKGVRHEPARCLFGSGIECHAVFLLPVLLHCSSHSCGSGTQCVVGRHCMIGAQAHEERTKRHAASKALMHCSLLFCIDFSAYDDGGAKRQITGVLLQPHLTVRKHGRHSALGHSCQLAFSENGGALVLRLWSTPLKFTQYAVPHYRPVP